MTKKLKKETIAYINKTKVLLEILLASEDLKKGLSEIGVKILELSLCLLYELTKNK